MKFKKSTHIIVTSIVSALIVGAVGLFASAKFSSPVKVAGTTELVEGSITWNATNSEKTEHSSNRVSYLRHTARGTGIYAYSNGQYDVSDDYILDSKGSDYLKYGIFISSEAGTSEKTFQFQNITSVSVTVAAGSTAGATFKVYTDKSSESTVAYTGTASASEETFAISTQVAGAKYLAVRPGNTYEIKIKSITINYECETGQEPTPDYYGISYVGYNRSYDEVGISGIDPESLITSAAEGSTVNIHPVALSGYTYYGSFGYSENIGEAESDGEGVLSFTMPSENVVVGIVVEENVVVTLDHITISGQQTNATVGDTFSFGGTVTAHYSDSSTANVTGSATFSGYNMNTAGEYTVTVSYTEGVTRTTTYTLTVSEPVDPSQVTISGTYAYSDRANHGTEYVPRKNWPNMRLTFKDDGTCEWYNERTGTESLVEYTYKFTVFFTYVATDNGANITIAMGLDLTKGIHTAKGYTSYRNSGSGDEAYDSAKGWSGGGTDRPLNNGFTVSSARNDSCVIASDRNSLTIKVYDQSHSYEEYDTFTFTLVS